VLLSCAALAKFECSLSGTFSLHSLLGAIGKLGEQTNMAKFTLELAYFSTH